MSENAAVLLDSITKAGDLHGRVVLSGSHGGLYAAYLAARSRARAVILHDAGIGLDDAGIACIGYCQGLGMASATVDHASARIGDAADMLRRGRISRSNALATTLGVRPGMEVGEALGCLAGAAAPAAEPPAYEEGQSEVNLVDGALAVLCLDSASMVIDEHAGRVIATGSHGGLVGGDPAMALKADAAAALFNDAGIGIERAGTTRLPALDARGIPAATVSAMSARIGQGRSTLLDGVLSVVNEAAAAAGAKPGVTAARWVEALQRRATGR